MEEEMEGDGRRVANLDVDQFDRRNSETLVTRVSRIDSPARDERKAN